MTRGVPGRSPGETPGVSVSGHVACPDSFPGKSLKGRDASGPWDLRSTATIRSARVDWANCRSKLDVGSSSACKPFFPEDHCASVNPALSSDKINGLPGARLVASSDLPAVFKHRQNTQRGGEMVANGGVTPVTRRRRDRLMQAAQHLVRRDEGDMASATVGVALAGNG